MIITNKIAEFEAENMRLRQENEKLRKFVLKSDDLQERISAVSCPNCPDRVNGECPIEDESCPQTDEEALQLWLKYGEI